MKFWTRCFSVFHLVVVAAVMDSKSHVGQSVPKLLGSNPFCGIFAMIIVAVQYQTIGLDEIGVIAIAVLILNGHVIEPDCRSQRFLVMDFCCMGI